MVLPHEEPLEGYAADIGGSAGQHTHGGDRVERPEEMPRKDDCDYVATNYDELEEGLCDENATVYVGDHIDITNKPIINAAHNVTLVGQYCDPDVKSVGSWIRHDDEDKTEYTSGIRHRAGGKPLQLYGVYMLGPRYYRSTEDTTAAGYDDMVAFGVWESAKPSDGTFRAVGCRFAGWTQAGIVLGAKNYATDAEVRRCTFDMNNFGGYGYGIEQYNGDLWVDRCFFDNCRHATAGFGYPREETDITNSVMGLGPGLSHAWDKHGLHNNINTDDNTAGHHLRMRNCTTMQTKTVGGGPQEAVKIRGVTEELSWFENCHFYHGSAPHKARANRNQVIRQEMPTWNNVEFRNRGNHYGRKGCPEGVGAPLADDDENSRDESDPPEETTPDPAPPPQEDIEEPIQELAVKGGNNPARYWIFVDGDVRRGEDLESNDAIKDWRDEGMHCLTGVIRGGTDTWELDANASLYSLWTFADLSLELDGEDVDRLPLVMREAGRKFEKQ